MTKIAQNLAHINETIDAAAKVSGRKGTDIELVGVTKSVTVDVIRELVSHGVTHIGENRVQDFLPKYDAINEVLQPTWHFIGHLQRNKVKFIIDKVAMIHSVDTIELAQEIDKRANQAGLVMDILAEVNIAKEDSKYGLDPKDVIYFSEKLAEFGNIKLKGLMCIAPFVEDPANNRPYFEKMYKLFLDINENGMHNHSLTDLSMGMSGDYAVAIEEGATMVRIGTALYS